MKLRLRLPSYRDALPALLLGLASCSEEEKVPTYRVATDNAVAVPTPESHKGSRPLRWQAPEEWAEEAPGQFQDALYRLSPETTVAVSSFPGDGGGVISNVNRWRKQIGLQPQADVGGQVIVLEEGESEAKWFELKGERKSILAAIIPLDDKTWFFKLSSPTSELDAARSGFESLLKSVQIGSKATPPAKPKVELNVPDDWEKSEGSPMRVASFRIPAKEGVEGDVSVIPIPGDVGTTLENVNRWRDQLRLPPLESADDPALGREEEGSHGSILFTHMVSDETLFSNDRHGAISTAIVKVGDITWFFKMAGEAESLRAHRKSFEEFVRSAAFP